MKTPLTKSPEASQTPVFPKSLHQVRPNIEKALPHSKPQKRDNVFSQSRDTREDRGERQMKTSQNNRTFPH